MKTIITTLITALIILALLCFAVYYVIRSKKKGRKCIGCPEGGCSSCSCACQGIQNK